MSDIIHVSRILCLQNEGLYKDMTEGKVISLGGEEQLRTNAGTLGKYYIIYT